MISKCYSITFTRSHTVLSLICTNAIQTFSIEISFWYVRGARRDMCVNRFESREISKNFWKRKEIEYTPIQVSSSQSSYTMQEFDRIQLYRKMYRNCDKQRRIVLSSPLSFLFHCRGIWERFTPKACYHAIQGGDLSCVPRSDAMRILLFPASRNRNSVIVNDDVLNKEHCSEKKRSLSHLSSKIHIHTYIHTQVDFSFLFIPNRSVHDRVVKDQKEGNLSAMWLSPFLSLFNREIIRVLSPSLTRSTYVERIAWIHSFARTGYHEKLVVSFFFFFRTCFSSRFTTLQTQTRNARACTLNTHHLHEHTRNFSTSHVYIYI